MGKCKTCGANAESEYCFRHRPRKPLKSGGFIRHKMKSKDPSDDGVDRMWELFNKLWDQLPQRKKCWSCETPIWGNNLSLYWDHLIEKSVYDEIKYEEWNLFFCCGDCHTKKGNGFPTQRHKAAIEEAKKRYEEWKSLTENI